MSLHIAVLLGGPGTEREVSLRSGSAVAAALRKIGHVVTEVDVTDDQFILPAGMDIAFNVIHGTYGEDGDLQDELERRRVAYTGDTPKSNRIAFDKILSKRAFTAAGIPTPKSETLTGNARPTLPLPLVVKAPRQGSSVGVYICKTQADLDAALTAVTTFGDDILVEEFIQGDELTVGILGDLALPIIQICPKDGVYDFKNKYPWLSPGGAADHFCPAPIEEKLTKNIQAIALAAHRSLGLQVYSRVDLLLPRHGEAFVLEVNTVPGMTESSLLPEAAGVAGLSMEQLCERIIELSEKRAKGGCV